MSAKDASGRRRRRAWTLLVAALSAAAGLGGAELLARRAGLRPWVYFGPLGEAAGVPVLHDPDPDLGWASRPGSYVVPLGRLLRDPARGDLAVEIEPDRSRRSGPTREAGARAAVLFLGCSYTFGWPLADDETYVWEVQERLPSLECVNFGTGAYGSYQSLLRLERYLGRREGPVPALVVYGLAGHHGTRDVAAYEWRKMISLQGSEPIGVPRAAVDEGGALVRLGLESHPIWPLAERSALVTWMADRWARWRTRGRTDDADRVQAAVVRELDRTARAAGSRLLVVTLEASDAQHAAFGRAFEEAGIDHVSCQTPLTSSREHRVPGDGHPDAVVHASWGECIAQAVRERLEVP